MVPELARQSVIIKSKNNTSVILGNYECGYALGVMSKIAGLVMDDTYTDMVSWHTDVMKQLESYEPLVENEQQVMRMLTLLEPSSEIDEQVKLLYHIGYEEQRPWEI